MYMCSTSNINQDQKLIVIDLFNLFLDCRILKNHLNHIFDFYLTRIFELFQNI